MTDVKKIEENITTITLPVYVYEEEQVRHERREKRLIIAVIIAVILLFISNCVWIAFVSQYEVSSSDVLVDTEGSGNANYIGQDGDIYNGKDQSENSNN